MKSKLRCLLVGLTLFLVLICAGCDCQDQPHHLDIVTEEDYTEVVQPEEEYPTFTFGPASFLFLVMGGDFCETSSWPAYSLSIQNHSRMQASISIDAVAILDYQIEYYGMVLPCLPGSTSWIVYTNNTVVEPLGTQAVRFTLTIPNDVPSGFYAIGLECRKIGRNKRYIYSDTFILTDEVEKYTFPIIIQVNRAYDYRTSDGQFDYCLPTCPGGEV